MKGRARDHSATLFIAASTCGLAKYDSVNAGKVCYYATDYARSWDGFLGARRKNDFH